MASSKFISGGSPATLEDIAQRVGVSKVAVSAVLSGSTGNNTRVGEATRKRILDAARELNYAPNGIARMLRRNSTDIIGLYLGEWLLNTHDLFLGEVVSGLQIGCREHKKDLLIHSTHTGPSIDNIYQELTNRKIDGLVVFANEHDPLTNRLASSSLPVIAIADAVPMLPSVVADDRRGSELIVEYLASKGHERVLYRRGLATQTSSNRRHEAFHEAAAGRGMTVLEDDDRIANFDFVLSAYEKSVLSVIPSKRPTAIVCGNDLLAYATYDYCEENDFRVPHDFSIVGFDGIVPQVRPAAVLTTIRAPWSEVAQTALALVMKRLAGESVSEETVLPVELVIGKTA